MLSGKRPHLPLFRFKNIESFIIWIVSFGPLLLKGGGLVDRIRYAHGGGCSKTSVIFEENIRCNYVVLYVV